MQRNQPDPCVVSVNSGTDKPDKARVECAQRRWGRDENIFQDWKAYINPLLKFASVVSWLRECVEILCHHPTRRMVFRGAHPTQYWASRTPLGSSAPHRSAADFASFDSRCHSAAQARRYRFLRLRPASTVATHRCASLHYIPARVCQSAVYTYFMYCV
ncbi:hypothetical protein OBBRIDRAFT_175066 [Obba rivulosa]|uniref:Uncharacterized protein n=1 Tax=Obba rivulosa TaxID=1052685 RepID=A0A8E2APS8_9APHY|nr:hypothetical protein OBBRIDRAFT_175066 [Obba rivulosa]